MKKRLPSTKMNIFSHLSLRKRFAFGLGSMLMPFFILAVSSIVMFEQAITQFETAENELLEERFPLEELKLEVSKARPIIELLLLEPVQRERRDRFQALDLSITRYIENIQEKSNTPEKYGLLNGVSNSWDSLADTIQQYPHNLDLDGLTPDEKAMARSALIRQIRQDLETVLFEIDKIGVRLLAFQSYDNTKRARELIRRERFFIGFMTLAAISIALMSAILLSRSVLRSMQILIDGLEELSEGSLDNRIEWNNSDEFGRLASAINYTAEKLAQSQQALIESATLDGLTGVFNRREFNRLLTIEVERSRRTHNPVSMVMVDVDHFKSINDTYGHQSGDDALRWVSAILRQEIRPGDIAARYGGEEFAVILPNTNGEDAGVVAERIRQKMESGLVPIQKGLVISLTASLGCATYPFVGDSEFLLMSAADKALYHAKQSGRNRVCHAQCETESPKVESQTEQSVVL